MVICQKMMDPKSNHPQDLPRSTGSYQPRHLFLHLFQLATMRGKFWGDLGSTIPMDCPWQLCAFSGHGKSQNSCLLYFRNLAGDFLLKNGRKSLFPVLSTVVAVVLVKSVPAGHGQTTTREGVISICCHHNYQLAKTGLHKTTNIIWGSLLRY